MKLYMQPTISSDSEDIVLQITWDKILVQLKLGRIENFWAISRKSDSNNILISGTVPRRDVNAFYVEIIELWTVFFKIDVVKEIFVL